METLIISILALCAAIIAIGGICAAVKLQK